MTRTQPNGVPPRILVVEDEAIVARDIERELTELGYEVAGAVPDAAAALAIIDRGPPDLVLLDIEMPGTLDGIELATLLREREGPPVVFLTAYAGSATIERAKRAMPYGYLIKPFDEQDLRTTVELALHKSHVEAELRRMQARHRAVVENAAEGIALFDLGGRVREANAACERITGYSRRELDGLPIRALLDLPAPRRTLPPRHDDAPAAERREMRLRRRDGATVDVEVAVSRLPAPERRFVAVVHDITARKAADRALRQANDALEQRVAARTAELTRALRDLEAFSYSVSHDLQGPAAGVRSLAEVLLARDVDSMSQPAQRTVRLMHASAKRMQQIIQDLLALAKVARIVPRPARVEVAELAAELRLELQAREPDRDVAQIVEGEPFVRADVQLLRVALGNLLDNAWKFTRLSPRALVTIAAAPHPDGTVVSVRDNGAGFDPDRSEQLFEPFVRLHDDRAYEGSGIGLATVRRAVEAMGGRAWAEGSPGAGAVFYLLLPKVSSDGTRSAPPSDSN